MYKPYFLDLYFNQKNTSTYDLSSTGDGTPAAQFLTTANKQTWVNSTYCATIMYHNLITCPWHIVKTIESLNTLSMLAKHISENVGYVIFRSICIRSHNSLPHCLVSAICVCYVSRQITLRLGNVCVWLRVAVIFIITCIWTPVYDIKKHTLEWRDCNRRTKGTVKSRFNLSLDNVCVTSLCCLDVSSFGFTFFPIWVTLSVVTH